MAKDKINQVKQQLIFDSISYTKMDDLAAGEIRAMKNKIRKDLRIYVPGYSVLIAIGIYFLLRGPGASSDFHRRIYSEISEQRKILYWQVAPYFSLFLLVLSTIFLAIYYSKSIHPLVLDIKKCKKMAIFYRPKKTAMTLFNRYYITIPLSNNQQIEISRHDFESINEGDLLCLEMGPASFFLLNLRNGEHNIHVDDLTL
ncbi:MAG TPA: hypothetical protein VGI82_09490 [Chitinophagaceae bacterium]